MEVILNGFAMNYEDDQVTVVDVKSIELEADLEVWFEQNEAEGRHVVYESHFGRSPQRSKSFDIAERAQAHMMSVAYSFIAKQGSRI
jgi:hypothetical protein